MENMHLETQVTQPTMTHHHPSEERVKLIKQLEIFKIQGRDKHGHPVLRISGKHFPARFVDVEAVKKHLEDEIFPGLHGTPFSVVYVHTGVKKAENFPGISALKSIYDAVPVKVRANLEAFYFLHPGLQSRLFLATFGRLLFSGGDSGLYGKVRYVNRLEFLWDYVKRNEIEMPEFVYDVEEEMEFQPTGLMDYGLESDHPRVECGGGHNLDSTVSTYSMRCIA